MPQGRWGPALEPQLRGQVTARPLCEDAAGPGLRVPGGGPARERAGRREHASRLERPRHGPGPCVSCGVQDYTSVQGGQGAQTRGRVQTGFARAARRPGPPAGCWCVWWRFVNSPVFWVARAREKRECFAHALRDHRVSQQPSADGGLRALCEFQHARRFPAQGRRALQRIWRQDERRAWFECEAKPAPSGVRDAHIVGVQRDPAKVVASGVEWFEHAVQGGGVGAQVCHVFQEHGAWAQVVHEAHDMLEQGSLRVAEFFLVPCPGKTHARKAREDDVHALCFGKAESLHVGVDGRRGDVARPHARLEHGRGVWIFLAVCHGGYTQAPQGVCHPPDAAEQIEASKCLGSAHTIGVCYILMNPFAEEGVRPAEVVAGFGQLEDEVVGLVIAGVLGQLARHPEHRVALVLKICQVCPQMQLPGLVERGLCEALLLLGIGQGGTQAGDRLARLLVDALGRPRRVCGEKPDPQVARVPGRGDRPADRDRHRVVNVRHGELRVLHSVV